MDTPSPAPGGRRGGDPPDAGAGIRRHPARPAHGGGDRGLPGRGGDPSTRAGQAAVAVFVKESELEVPERERVIAQIGRAVHDYFTFRGTAAAGEAGGRAP